MGSIEIDLGENAIRTLRDLEKSKVEFKKTVGNNEEIL